MKKLWKRYSKWVKYWNPKTDPVLLLVSLAIIGSAVISGLAYIIWMILKLLILLLGWHTIEVAIFIIAFVYYIKFVTSS